MVGQISATLARTPFQTSTGPALSAYQSGSAIRWESIICTSPITRAHPFDLAYADQMMGPWFIHPKPVLTVEQSLFVTKDLDPNSRSDWVNGPDYLYAHIASPDVHVDQNAKQILMFFHGLLPDGDQQTRLAHIRKWTILFGSAPSARAILPACISVAWALVFYASLG